MSAVPPLPPGCNSWIITRKSDGVAVYELYDPCNVARVNRELYDIHTAADYLAALNRRSDHV